MPDSESGEDLAPGPFVRHPHAGGDIPDYHEPVWLGESVLRDRAGRPHKRAGHRFARVICNNPGCKFEALVSEDHIAREVERA